MKRFEYIKQTGAATLITSIMLLFIITFIVLFAASYSILRQKITANQYRYSQALQAADAGLEFGIVYLQENKSAILANNSGGYLLPFLNANTQNVTLANGSKYSIIYTNPIANNYDLINVASTGVNSDSSVTRVVNQQVQNYSMIVTLPDRTITTLGEVEMKGSSKVTNTETDQTIQAGSAIDLSGSAETIISTGTGSTAAQLGADVEENAPSLSGLSEEDLLENYFGTTSANLKNKANDYYSNDSNTNYSDTLSGKEGTFIWIDQTDGKATIDGSAVIGSVTQPVLLIINGDFHLSGSAVIYGIVYVIGGTDTDITGSSQIIGSLITTGELKLNGSMQITFNSSVLNALQQMFSSYAKIPGSWRDF